MTIRPITPARCRFSIHLTGDRRTGRLLGGQILGNRRAEISKRIDIVATAIFQEASVEYLNDLDLSYTPPFSSPWDPVQMAAQAWCAQLPQLVARIRRPGTWLAHTQRPDVAPESSFAPAGEPTLES